jgi:hypothetical protein
MFASFRKDGLKLAAAIAHHTGWRPFSAEKLLTDGLADRTHAWRLTLGGHS